MSKGRETCKGKLGGGVRSRSCRTTRGSRSGLTQVMHGDAGERHGNGRERKRKNTEVRIYIPEVLGFGNTRDKYELRHRCEGC